MAFRERSETKLGSIRVTPKSDFVNEITIENYNLTVYEYSCFPLKIYLFELFIKISSIKTNLLDWIIKYIPREKKFNHRLTSNPEPIEYQAVAVPGR